MNTDADKLSKNALVCLDIEGTLISNAVSQIPRPNLFGFLEGLAELADIALFTSVSPERVRAITELLVKEGSVPHWFKNLESFHPHGNIKYKNLVANSMSYEAILLVDDQPAVIDAGEVEWFVQISEFLPPYSQDDQELLRTLEKIKCRLRLPNTFKARFRPSADRLRSIAEEGRKGMENLDSEDIGKWSK